MCDDSTSAAHGVEKISAHPLDPERATHTLAGGENGFQKLLRFSKDHSDDFWCQVASEFEWIKPWDTVRKGEMPSFEFFSGGIMNPCTNLLDRHVDSGGSRMALIWEGEDGISIYLTYEMLLGEVCRFANVLKSLGVGRGDAVAIFLPNVPECLVAILACFRLGAIYNTVFSGFSVPALTDRLVAFAPKVVITADSALRRGKKVPLKAKVDDCLKALETGCKVIVIQRTGDEITMVPGRDLWWHIAMASAAAMCPAEPLEANEPGLVFYTSGTSGKPKGVVHSGAGFIINNYIHAKYQLDLHPKDVLWCTADIGWLTMHIWGIAGALANGATTIFTEGALDFPEPHRFFRLLDKHRVTKVFTSPSAIRMLMRCDDTWQRGFDVGSLEVIGLVGEPLNPEAWEWMHSTLGKRNIYINNTWGQTELAGCPLAGAAWLTPMKPASCGKEFLGNSVDIVDDEGNPVGDGVKGNLVLRKPFPMMIRTLWKDHERYLKEYFRQVPGCYFSYDAAVRDEDGYFWVLGRLDDVINVAGHRLSTMEIENAILTCDDISEVAVVGCPDHIKGLVPAAFVIPRSRKVDHPALYKRILHAVEIEISKIALPERIYVVDDLPKTASGKIMRRLLRDLVTTGEVQGDVSGLEDMSAVEKVREAVQRPCDRPTNST
jgi:acetyl-CoA synthetase